MFLVGDDRGFGLALITRADGHRPGGDLRVGSNLSAHRGPTGGAQGGAEYVAAHARSTQHEVNTCIQQPTSAHPRPLCGPDESAHCPLARSRGSFSPVDGGIQQPAPLLTGGSSNRLPCARAPAERRDLLVTSTMECASGLVR